MKDSTVDAIKAHAIADYPRECCGLIIVVRGKERYVPCKNIAGTPNEHFILDPQDYAVAEDTGDVIGVVHSHPDTSPQPSQADRAMCEASGLEWFIVNVHRDINTVQCGEIVSFKPAGFVADLVGRPFVHGVHDCYSLVRDYYARELKLDIPDFARQDAWWEKGDNLYLDNFESAGFERVTDGSLQKGDGVLMQIRSKVVNHAAIYVGNGIILHHLYGRLSGHDLYDGYFQEVTRMVVRHREASNV